MLESLPLPFKQNGYILIGAASTIKIKFYFLYTYYEI